MSGSRLRNQQSQPGSPRCWQSCRQRTHSTPLDEIDKVLELIKEEAKADKENFDWCVKKRDENNDELDMKIKEILSLEKEVDRLDKLINDPETGLKRQMSFPEVTRKATRVWPNS